MIIVEIAGRLGADPETRYTPSNIKVTNLRVATNVYKQGKEETVWWRVTVWGDRFDKMLSYMKKGSAVIVLGEMNKPEIWTNRDNQPQVGLEMTAEMIKFSPFGGKNDQAEGQAQGESFGGSGSYGGSSSQDSSGGYANFGEPVGAANGMDSEQDDALPF